MATLSTVDAWFYGHDGTRLGPFSSRQLKDLADLGTIERTDTVWKQGVEQGVPAARVKNLFLIAVVQAPDLPDLPAVVAIVASLPVAAVPPGPTASAKIQPAPMPTTKLIIAAATAATAAPAVPAARHARPVPAKPKPKQGRAVALKGADIVSQDGVKARYRRKCTCGLKDQAVQTIVISNKTTNTFYFCPKCRKSRPVSIQCTSG